MEQKMYSIADILTSSVEKAIGKRPQILRAKIAGPSQNTDVDYGLNAFQIRENPQQNIAEVIEAARGKIAAGMPEGVIVSVKDNYINFRVSSSLLAQTAGNIINKPNGGITPANKRTMVEYFSPNTNKPAHLGHLRNMALGKSLSATLEFLGHEVLQANLTNDRGAHICKSMLAYQMFGENSTPESTGTKGDHFVGDYYVKYEKALQAEIAPIVTQIKAEPENEPKMKRLNELKNIFALITKAEEEIREKEKEEKKKIPDTKTEAEKIEIKKMKEEMKMLKELEETIIDKAKKESSLEKQVSAMLLKWEANDPETRALWEKMNGWVLGGFRETLDRMNVHFDVEYFESEIYNMGRDIVMDGLAKGIFEQDPSGAVVADLKKLGITKGEGKKVLLRSDGTTVYTTQDLAIAKMKMEDHKLDNSFYVVAGEQDDHFRALFGILKALGYTWVNKLKHMSYGMVELPAGRMKSREGTVVDVDDLLNDLRDRVKVIAAEKGAKEGNEKISDMDADKIGKAAAQYYLLSSRPESTMKFDPEESVKFEGKTGPYILYQYVRSGKILEQGKEKNMNDEPDFTLLQEPAERDLLLKLTEFTEVMRSVEKNLDQTLIATYVFELSQLFSSFYQKCPVLKEGTDPKLASARLKLVEYSHILIKQSLDLLAIETVEKM